MIVPGGGAAKGRSSALKLREKQAGGRGQHTGESPGLYVTF